MNIFVLNSGRCGSTTFIQACQHISNYTSAHESRITLLGQQRLAYPQNHIEADNRLSWFLGRLDQVYGDKAFYVHLMRNDEDTIASFSRRAEFGIMKAYREGIIMDEEDAHPIESIARDYLDTVNTNIELFLKDKTNHMGFRLESAQEDFTLFWERIGAVGDLQAALEEWGTAYNASERQ